MEFWGNSVSGLCHQGSFSFSLSPNKRQPADWTPMTPGSPPQLMSTIKCGHHPDLCKNLFVPHLPPRFPSSLRPQTPTLHIPLLPLMLLALLWGYAFLPTAAATRWWLPWWPSAAVTSRMWSQKWQQQWWNCMDAWLRSIFSLKWHLKVYTFALGAQYSTPIRWGHKCTETWV